MTSVFHDLKVSRYDPMVRYTDSTTWTSISDIGARFEDGVLVETEYRRIEDLYVRAFRLMLGRAGNPELVLESVEFSETHLPPSWQLDGASVLPDEATAIWRAMLREEFWCILSSKDDNFFATVSSDYYTFIGSSLPSWQEIEAIERSGLYVAQHVPFPFRPDVALK